MAKMTKLQRRVEDIQLVLNVLEDSEKYKDKIVRELESYSVDVGKPSEQELEKLLGKLLEELHNQLIIELTEQTEPTLASRVEEAFGAPVDPEVVAEVMDKFGDDEILYVTGFTPSPPSAPAPSEHRVNYEQLKLNFDKQYDRVSKRIEDNYRHL